MNASYRKTLLLALSLLTGNALAMSLSRQADSYSRDMKSLYPYLFGLEATQRNENFFGPNINPNVQAWNNLIIKDVFPFIKQNITDKDTDLNNILMQLINANQALTNSINERMSIKGNNRSVAMTFDQRVKGTYSPESQLAIIKNIINLIDAQIRLFETDEKILTKKLAKARDPKTRYIISNRDKDIANKTQALEAVKRKSVLTVLCGDLARLLQKATQKIIADKGLAYR